MLTRTHWSDAIYQLSECDDHHLAIKSQSVLTDARLNGFTTGQAYYQLIAEPRWAIECIKRNDPVITLLTRVACGLGLRPEDQIDVDGIAIQLVQQLIEDSTMGMGFGEPAAIAVRELMRQAPC